MQSVSIIGAGRLGGALAIALSDAGYSIEQLIYRTKVHDDISDLPQLHSRARKLDEAGRIGSDVLIISTTDKDIEAAGRFAARLLDARTVVLHTSGALSSGILSAAARNGNQIGSMHPLLSVSTPRTGADALKGTYFCIEGNEAAVSAGVEIVRSLGGRPFTIAEGSKPLYHASAVLASGHLVALFQASVDALANCGLQGASPAEVLLPLVESTVKNLKANRPEAALTGPFARGDAGTIEFHLAALEAAHLDRVIRVYLELGSIAIDLAERNNAAPEEVEKLREKIKLAQGLAK